MALLARLALVAALFGTGCAARAVNTAQVFKPVTGVIKMQITVPAGESVAKVQFQVNDKVVGEDEDPSDGYTADIDTSSLEAGVLAKIAAVGVRANGTNVVLRENFILIGDNAAEDAEEDEAASDPEATDTATEDEAATDEATT